MKKIIELFKRVFKLIKMGIVNTIEARNKKQAQTVNQNDVLTDQELEFILLKLRDSTYKGFEFDMYARVYKKIADHIKK